VVKPLCYKAFLCKLGYGLGNRSFGNAQDFCKLCGGNALSAAYYLNGMDFGGIESMPCGICSGLLGFAVVKVYQSKYTFEENTAVHRNILP